MSGGGRELQRTEAEATSSGGTGGGDSVIAVTRRVVKNHPRKVMTLVLWCFGVFCMFFAPAPMRITPEMQARYQEKMDSVLDLSGDFTKTTKELDKLYSELDSAKSFGWYFRSADRAKVNEIKSRMAPHESELGKLKKQKFKLESEARNELGLWSEAGIQEARDVFWTSYKRGRRSAQVGIIWDLMWELFRSDNYEDSVNFLFRIIWIVVSNAVMFLITSTIVFMFNVVTVIRSFQPSLLSAIFFYLLAVTAAISTVAGMVSLLVGAGVGSAVVIGKNAQYLPQSRSRRYVRQRRSHQD